MKFKGSMNHYKYKFRNKSNIHRALSTLKPALHPQNKKIKISNQNLHKPQTLKNRLSQHLNYAKINLKARRPNLKNVWKLTLKSLRILYLISNNSCTQFVFFVNISPLWLICKGSRQNFWSCVQNKTFII